MMQRVQKISQEAEEVEVAPVRKKRGKCAEE
jgi:hypothetical protein